MRKEIFPWLLLFLLLCLGVLYVINKPDLLDAMLVVTPSYILIIAVFDFLYLVSIGFILKSILSFFNIHLFFKECMGVISVSAMGNYLTIQGGGTLSKALYLKKSYRLSYSSFIASMSVTHILDLVWIGCLGVLLIIVVGGNYSTWGLPLILAFAVVGIFSFALLSLSKAPGYLVGRVGNVIVNVLEGWGNIRKDKRLIVKLSLLLLIKHICETLEVFVGYSAFSIDISIYEAMLLTMISALSCVVRITPANLGIHEVVVAGSSHLLGLGFEPGLMVAALIRVVSVAVVCCSALIFGFSLLRGRNCDSSQNIPE